MDYTIFAQNANGRFIIGLDGQVDNSGMTYDRANVNAIDMHSLKGWDTVWAVAYDNNGDEMDNILIKG